MCIRPSCGFLVITLLFLFITAIPMGQVSAMMKAGFGQSLNANTWLAAVPHFRDFAASNVSDLLDVDVIKLMSKPHCGIGENASFGNSSRSKRYALAPTRWPQNYLSYNILSYPAHLKRFQVDAVIARAFAAWSVHTNLYFTREYSASANIIIEFSEPFYNPNVYYAYAFYPDVGYIHFNHANYWTINSYRGVNLFQVAIHEIGHSLGLDHSNSLSSVMYSFYRGYNPNCKLDYDDILGIQSLYGRPSSIRPNRRYIHNNAPLLRLGLDSNSNLSRNNRLCQVRKVDTVFSSANGQINVFSGDQYYTLNENFISDGTSKLISDEWPGLPDNIDAAFTYKDGATYFFKDSLYWRYNGLQLDNSFPRKIREDFVGIPDHLDAAMALDKYDKIIFFKGKMLWSYDLRLKYKPSEITLYNKGWPTDIDAAFAHTNGSAYFFKNDKYYHLLNITHPAVYNESLLMHNVADLRLGCENNARTTGNNT